MRVRYVNVALGELRRAIRYYATAAPGLGDQFADAIDATLLRVRRNLRAGTPVVGGRRRLNVDRFPYSIIVEVWKQEQAVVVIAVAHQKRKPGYWRARKRPTNEQIR